MEGRRGPIGGTDAGALAPAFGVNFRVDVFKLLRAAWETAKVAAKIKAVAEGPFDPSVWIEVGREAIAAGKSIMASLVETMRPIDYVTPQFADGIWAVGPGEGILATDRSSR